MKAKYLVRAAIMLVIIFISWIFLCKMMAKDKDYLYKVKVYNKKEQIR